MKKNLILLSGIAFAILSLNANAQNAYTAYTLSDNKAEGTARSVAMGNAMTALGGDLGAISINPASSAVYKYNEASITPAFYNSSVNTNCAGIDTKSTRTTFGLANFGGLAYLPVGNKHTGLVSFSFGLTYNKQNNFNMTVRNNALVNGSSYADALANNMNGYLGYDMDINNSQDPFRNFGVGMWPYILAWNGSIVDSLDVDPRGFVAGTYYDPQAYNSYQTYNRKQYGSNSVTNINTGFNFGNKFYVGVTIGLHSVWNKIEETYTEESTDVDGQTSFSDSGFDFMRQYYHQTTSGSGIDFQLGLIYTPAPFVRLGASISSPTWYFLTDKCYWDLDTYFDDNYHASIGSPEASFDYRVNTPFRYSLGAALTFPWGAFSVDYEGTTYSQARLHNSPSTEHAFEEDFSGINTEIKSVFDRSDKIRFGAEINPVPYFSLRGGFQYGTAGLKKEVFGKTIESYIGSFGIGFTTKCGFFTDIAYQQSIKKQTLIYDAGDLVSDYVCAETPITKKDWRLLFTFGYRF